MEFFLDGDLGQCLSTGVDDEGFDRMLTPWKFEDDRGGVRFVTHSYSVWAANRKRGEKVQAFLLVERRSALSSSPLLRTGVGHHQG